MYKILMLLLVAILFACKPAMLQVRYHDNVIDRFDKNYYYVEPEEFGYPQKGDSVINAGGNMGCSIYDSAGDKAKFNISSEGGFSRYIVLPGKYDLKCTATFNNKYNRIPYPQKINIKKNQLVGLCPIYDLSKIHGFYMEVKYVNGNFIDGFDDAIYCNGKNLAEVVRKDKD